MHVVAESEDRESVTEIVLASRAHVIRRLQEMNRDLVDVRQRLDDSDWPAPIDEQAPPSSAPTSVPPSPPPSERH
jgi:hypothetical protein